MKKNHSPSYLDRKWFMPLLTIFVLSLILVLTLSLGHAKFSSGIDDPPPKFAALDRNFDRLGLLPKLPSFAYSIWGSKGDVSSVKRLLEAVYHPRNYYVLHLDLDASDAERLELAKYVKSESLVFREFGNVMVVGNANLVTYKGPTMMASTLHAIAILLKKAKDWDWFISLSASDYPLVSQDGIRERDLL